MVASVAGTSSAAAAVTVVPAAGVALTPSLSKVSATQMKAMASAARVLPNMRIVLYQQTTFDLLRTVRFSDMVTVMHNDEPGGDRYLMVATSVALTCGNSFG